ncbi:HDIG domain-containing protein [Candidatus Microgenomates bacterium]|nr:HDIG domain-containing protein [Candidatus Microgenomates bacterium]
MTRDEAYTLVTSWTKNKNLVKHMLAVETAMGALAKHFDGDVKEWKTLGLIHDADYEKYPDKHPLVLVEELEKIKEGQKIIDAVKSHAWEYQKNSPEPKTKMEWSLYCCDELTGFIVAVTLVRPEKKLSAVTVENILKKWPEKAFAKGVHREQIEYCDEKLGIKLPDFIQIVLSSMQQIAEELGL